MLIIPDRFKQILQNTPEYLGLVSDTASRFSEILEENKLEFFDEYTDHGIKHINSVLKVCSEIITDDTYNLLSEYDISVLILSVLLHDLGMHTSYYTFKAMIDGQYDAHIIREIDNYKWRDLWNDYLREAKRFNSRQRKRIFGDENQGIKIPDLSNKDNLNGVDKKLIGEFIRRHHPRIAHEISCNGIIGHNGILQFATRKENIDLYKLAGIVARSHGIKLRSTFPYLKSISVGNWQNPYNSHVIFIMVVLRIADYFQISSDRIPKYTLKLKGFNSQISELEHIKHATVKFMGVSQFDNETLYVEAHPISSSIYLQLKTLFDDIQNELDTSWAVLGEIYGRRIGDKPALTYRRIESNFDEKHDFQNQFPFVADKMCFTVDDELSKLLIAPLYGNHPSYGIRELIQNAVDSSLERQRYCESAYTPDISVFIERNDSDYLFKIIDNGRGMSLHEIKNYFLKVGASFRKSLDWNKRFVDEDGNSVINRNGRFGIGVLAAFLIGEEIEVNTYSQEEKKGYSFRTTLEQEQIEVFKTSNVKEGTTIRIKLSKEVYEQIKSIDPYDNYIRKNSWLRWYTFDYPVINYYIDNKETDFYNFPLIPLLTKLNVEGFHNFKTKDYDVHWSYKEEHRQIRLTCNGIRVPRGYKWRIAQEIISDEIPIFEPSVHVFDGSGVFNLSLNRNYLNPDYLQFETELKTEIYKSIIAKMLTYDIDDIEQPMNFHHPALSTLVHTNYFKVLRSEKSYSFHELGYFKSDMKKTFRKRNPQFCQLLEKYFGDNSFIPKDLIKRKEIFDLAFQDLAYLI